MMANITEDYKKENTFSIGMLIALSSWALIFVTLVWGYVVFRLRQGAWGQPYMNTNVLALAIWNTIVLWLSSWHLSKGIKEKSKSSAGVAIALALLFLAGQMFLWSCLERLGLHWQKNLAGSFFFLLTGFHFAHILLVIPFLMLVWQNLENESKAHFNRGVRYFWDALLIVWFVLFVLIFIIQ